MDKLAYHEQAVLFNRYLPVCFQHTESFLSRVDSEVLLASLRARFAPTLLSSNIWRCALVCGPVRPSFFLRFGTGSYSELGTKDKVLSWLG